MPRRATLLILILALRASIARAEPALSQLRTLSADAQIPAAPKAASPLTGRPCEIHLTLSTYKGTCFFANGTNFPDPPVYWIIRLWLPGETQKETVPWGPEIVGYPKVAKQERSYNEWVSEILGKFEYRGVVGTTGEPGWTQTWFALPPAIAELGEVERFSLRIPLYVNGARIVRFWNLFQTDCAGAQVLDPNTAFTSAVCGLFVSEFDPDAVGSDGTIRDQLLQRRARWLVAAYQDSLRFDALIDELPDGVRRPEQLPDGFLKKLSAVAEDIDNDIQAAADSPRLKTKAEDKIDEILGGLR